MSNNNDHDHDYRKQQQDVQKTTEVIVLTLLGVFAFMMLFYLFGVFAIIPIGIGIYLGWRKANKKLEEYEQELNQVASDLTEEERRIVEEVRRQAQRDQE